MPCHPGSVCCSKCLEAPAQPWPWVRKQNQKSLEAPCDHTSGKDKSPDKHTGQAGSMPEGLVHSPAIIHSLIHSFTPSSIYFPFTPHLLTRSFSYQLAHQLALPWSFTAPPLTRCSLTHSLTLTYLLAHSLASHLHTCSHWVTRSLVHRPSLLHTFLV